MSPELKIINDLAVGRSTADSTAGRIGIPTGAVQVILNRLEQQGKVFATPLGPLHVWNISNDFLHTLPPGDRRPVFPA